MAQTSQFARSLACKLATEQFGEAPGAVCRHLASKGPQTLPEVIRGTGLPPSVTKQALLILVQHNAVMAYTQGGEETYKGSKPSYNLYALKPDRLLQTLRHPKFLLHIKDEMGDVAEQIVEMLLENGRLRLDQVTSGIAARVEKETDKVVDSVRNVFISMVQSHYIERAPPSNLPLPGVPLHPNSVKRRSSKAGSESYAHDQAQALKSLEDVTYDKQRFKLPQELVLEAIMSDGPAVNGTTALDGAEEGAEKRPAEDEPAGKPPPPKKQRIKAGSAKADPAAASTSAVGGGPAVPAITTAAVNERMNAEPNTILWRVNNEEFNRRFRHMAIVGMVAEKLDQDAATVVQAMLNTTRPHEGKLQEERSVQLSEEEVASSSARLIATNVLPAVNSPVPTILRTIASDTLEMITFAGPGPGGDTYYINLQRVIDIIRLKSLEAVVRDKYGVPGLRVFRLLLLRGQLEQKQIADIGMLAPKDTRELLYRMLKDGYVALQDIPKTSDRAPSRTFYTWYINVGATSDRLSVELYRAAGNVWQRFKDELSKEAELLGMIESAKETGQMNFTLTQQQRAQIGRLKFVTEMLETSLMQLDDMIATFNDF